MSGRRPSEPMRERLFVENVTVPAGRLRAVNEDAVARLADSFRRLGQRTPISVRMDGDDVVLVAGLHRLRAAQSLGWDQIDAVHCKGDETDARLWEIAENLHRAELTAVERAEHVAEWVRLTADKLRQRDAVSAVAGGRGNTGGVRAAARDLGISEPIARRAATIAALPQETRDKARAEDWSQKRLLAAAQPIAPTAPEQKDADVGEIWMAEMLSWWNRGKLEWRARFWAEVIQPEFGRGRAA